MEKGEVIYISSDDEEETRQNVKSRQRTSDVQKSDDDSSNQMKIEIISDEEERRENNVQKRKASQTNETNNSYTAKKVKLTNNKDESETVANNDCSDSHVSKSETIANNDCSNSRVSESDPLQKECQQRKVLKPQLIIKEKRSISEMEQDIFPMFISLCLQKDKSEDMKIIVNKLKRRYELLDPNYAHSDAFTSFLNEKRNDIMNSTCKLYIFIAEVMNEMKKSRKGKSQLPNNENHIIRASCSNAVGSSNSIINTVQHSNNTKCKEKNTESNSTQRKIERISKAMMDCEDRIKKLERSETDFDDENNSNYIKLENYKYRMVELYNKYCELTGESADAGRPYLRPKHISASGIVTVDRAIISFINSKISKRNKLKKNGAFADDVIFPDYRDIVQCVERCNELNNLQLDNKKQQQIAKNAFTKLGEYLQRMRRDDYLDTFSLFFEEEDEDDPALKDSSLAEKLMQNRKEGEKRLSNVFQEFVKKQEELKDNVPREESTSENEEEDETSSLQNEDHNVDDQDEEDNDQNEDTDNCENACIDDQPSGSENQEEILTDKSIPKKDSEHALDKDISNKKEEINMDKDRTNNNIEHSLTTDEPIGDMTEIDECLGASSLSRTKNKSDIVESTESAKLNIGGFVNVISCKNNTNLNSEEKTTVESPNTITLSNAISPAIATHSVTATGQEDDAPNVVSEELTNNDALEEEKPVLRVRSFAKPPTTWEDERQRMDKSSTDESATKVVSKDSLVDLTIDMPKNSVIKKSTKAQSGSKLLPLGKEKRKTLVIPAGNNVISVKNITNNYVKLSGRSIDTGSSSKFRNSQVIRSLRQVVGLNSSPTIIRVPFASPQTANAGGAKNAQMKRNETVVRIIQPNNKMIVLPAKQVGDNTSKTSTKNLPSTKPK